MARDQKSTQELKGDEIQLVSFNLGDEMFAVNVSQVRDIVRVDKITSVPRMPDFIEGVVNLRGQILTVINLRKRFSLEEREHDSKSRIITGDLGTTQFGIIVDSVSEVIRVSPELIEPPPEIVSGSIDSTFLTGICKHSDSLIMLLDLERILNDEEMTELDKAVEYGKTKNAGVKT